MTTSREPATEGERLMVCVGASPASASLVRAARRMASALRASFIAAYVERPGARVAPSDSARVTATLRLAESLGAEVVVLSADRVADALGDLARRRSVTRILVGKPTHSRWRDLVVGSIVDDLVRESGAIDVHVISGADDSHPSADRARRAEPLLISRYLRAALAIACAAALAAALRDVIDFADVAMIFLVGIVAVAAFLGRGPSIFASALSVGLFNFFFVPPFYTLAVTDFRHVLTFAVMLAAGLLISTLVERIRSQSSAARERERRTAALYALTRALAGAHDAAAIAAVAAREVEGVFGQGAVLFVPDLAHPSGVFAPGGADDGLDASDRAAVRAALDEAQRSDGEGTQGRVLALPLRGREGTVGVLAVVPTPSSRFEDPAQRALLDAFAAQIALALERTLLAEDARRARLRAETEEMRSSLLSSVSHDLRTPVGSVLGAATTILELGDSLPLEQRIELVSVIRDESARLARLIRNILDLTRVEAPGLEPKKEWVPLEELVGAAMTRLEPRLAGRRVRIDVPSSVVAPLDPVLFEQLLVNLLENAIRHTPERTAIDVLARSEPGRVVVEVADRGPGLARGDEEKVFEKFVKRGTGSVGLGLAICRGVARAHGGTIIARPRDGGGASFVVTLPAEGEPPTVPEEVEP